MNPRFPRQLSLALTLVALLLPAAHADTIVRKGRVLSNVQVVMARWDQVQYRQGGNTLTLNGDDVERLERTSTRLGRVRQAIQAKNYKLAMDRTKDNEGQFTTEWEKAEADYLEAEVLRLSGDPRQAYAEYKSYLATYKDKKDFWVPHAVYGQGLCALMQRQSRTAETHFNDLATYGPNWRLRSRLGIARSQLLAANYSAARQGFNAVATDPRVPQELRQEAVVGKGKVLIGQQAYEAAIGELEKEFFTASDASKLAYNKPRAEATYLIGLAYKELGSKDKKNNELAEIWLLTTTALFRHHSDVYKQACSQLGDLYTKLGRSDRAADWKRRAGA